MLGLNLEVANNQTSIYYYCLNHYLVGDEISIVNDINHYDRTLELGTNYLDTDPFTFDNSLITPTLNKTINIPLANLQILDEINTIEYIAEDTSLIHF